MTNTTVTSPPSTDGLVRTLADVATICTDAGLQPGLSHWWGHTRVRVHCWPTHAFQVAVYALDAHGHHTWSAIFDYGTPAHVIAWNIRASVAAVETTAVSDDGPGDECSSCEGLVYESELDSRGLCAGCASQADHDPWVVTEGQFIDGELRHVVVDAEPMSREMAEHRARIHNDGQRWKDHGTTRRAIRRADHERGIR